MPYHGKAKVNPRNPQAFAICDRCSGMYNHVDLSFQMEYTGATMVNTQLLVCRTCYDVPQQQNKARILPPDPVPIKNPRPLNVAVEFGNTRTNPGFAIDFDVPD